MWIYIIVGICVAFVLLICFCLSVASFSFDNYREKLQEANNYRNSCGLTTLEFVNDINEQFFDGQIMVERCEEYKDHYSSGKIALSTSTMGANSLASFSIIAHELGHAQQDKTAKNLRKHWQKRRIGKIIGKLFLPCVLVGVLLSILNLTGVFYQSYVLYIGISFFGIAFFIFLFAIYLKYREIKIEKEASDYAIKFLNCYLTSDELNICKDFLNSARMTYWASLFKTMFGWTMLTKQNGMFK